MGKDFIPIDQEKEALTPKELAEIQKENLRLKQEVEIFKKGYGHIHEKVTEVSCHIKERRSLSYAVHGLPGSKAGNVSVYRRLYNRNRIHSSIGYQTPQAIEDQIRRTA